MLEEKIYQDYIRAFKAKEKQKAQFLSLVRSELKNRAISLRKEKLDDQEVLDVLKQVVKP